MVKMTMADGNVLEGTPEELKQMFEIFGEKDDEKFNISPAEEITYNGAVYTLVQREAQPGDVVVFTESKKDYVKNGKPYGPVSTDGKFLDDYCDLIPVYYENGGRTKTSVKVYAPVAKEELKVGDYAKVVKEGTHGFRYGDIIRIYDIVDYGSNRIRGEYVNGTKISFDYFYTSELVHATDEEVAAAKLTAKWAKIGRKPNEFKKGDIVKLLNRSGLVSRDIPIGTIGELAGDVNEELHAQFINKFTNISNYVVADNLELITPVEQRFDLTDGDLA